jgi:flagellar biosynthesis/type III secretory pathway protein FliH
MFTKISSCPQILETKSFTFSQKNLYLIVSMSSFLQKFFTADPASPKTTSQPIQTADRLGPLQAAITSGQAQPLTPKRSANLDTRSVVLPFSNILEAQVEIVKPSEPVMVDAEIPRAQSEASVEIKNVTPIAELPPFVESTNETVVPVNEGVSVLEETGPDSSRLFVNNFLQEINNLLLSGKKLEGMLKDKEAADASFVAANSSYELMRSKRMAVATSIAQLFGEGETSVSGENLKLVSEAYDNYLDSFNREAESLTGQARKEINKLSLKINAEKGNIKKMFEGAGGPTNVEKIKAVIRVCENLGAKARGLMELPKNLKKEIAERVANFVANDLEGAKMLLGNPTDIVGMLVRIYTDPTPAKN